MTFASIASINGSSQTSPTRLISLTASPIRLYLLDPPPSLRSPSTSAIPIVIIYEFYISMVEVLELELLQMVCLCRFLTLPEDYLVLLVNRLHLSSFWSISGRKNIVA